jgi:hypothetical protein
MIEEIISLFDLDRPNFTVNNAVNDVQIFPGVFSDFKGGDQSLAQTKFFQRNDNVVIKGIGLRAPYCYGLGQGQDVPAVYLLWRNEDFTSPQDIGIFKIPVLGIETSLNFFTPFHGGVATLQRCRIHGIVTSAGTAISMINTPAAIPNATVLYLDIWVKIQHNLPMEAV